MGRRTGCLRSEGFERLQSSRGPGAEPAGSGALPPEWGFEDMTAAAGHTAEASEVQPPPEPSRFGLSRPQSRLAWIRPAVWLPLVVMLAVLAVLWQWGARRLPYLLPSLPD